MMGAFLWSDAVASASPELSAQMPGTDGWVRRAKHWSTRSRARIMHLGRKGDARLFGVVPLRCSVTGSL